MALTFPLYIHRDRIGHIEVVRGKGQLGTSPDDVNTYQWKYSNGILQPRGSGLLTHRYGDGALALAHQVLGEIVRYQTARREAGEC